MIQKIPTKEEFFFKLCTGNTPYEFQSSVLNDSNKYIVVRSGRQLGKTEVIAVKALKEAMVDNQQILVVSSTQRQSDILYSRIRRFAHAIGLDMELLMDTRETLKFKNNSEIHSLPAGRTGETIRGFSPTLLILEEAAFIPDIVFEAVEPGLAHTGGKMWMISTPFGKKGFFYESFKKEYFSRYHFPASKYKDCYAKGWLERKKEELTDMTYLQEYEAEFLSESDAYFPIDLIKSCIGDIEGVDRPRGKKDYYLGIDCARYGTDETAYIILEVDAKDNARVIKIIGTSKKPGTDIIGRTIALNNVWHFKGIYIDETGGYGNVADVLMEEPNLIIEPVTFTLYSKERMYINLKNLMEKGRIKFPKHSKLIFQLQELIYKYTSRSVLQLEHPERGHDDYPDALALVCRCLETQKTAFGPF